MTSTQTHTQDLPPLNTKILIMLALIRHTIRGLVKEVRLLREVP